MYYQALDVMLSFIKDTIDQRENNICMNCEYLLIKAAGGDAHNENSKRFLVSMVAILIHESWRDI